MIKIKLRTTEEEIEAELKKDSRFLSPDVEIILEKDLVTVKGLKSIDEDEIKTLIESKFQINVEKK